LLSSQYGLKRFLKKKEWEGRGFDV